MVGRFRTAAIAATGFCLIASRVPAQFPPITDPTTDEQKCESNAGKAAAKFVNSKVKCIGNCMKAQREAAVPNYFNCLPPYADPVEQACINDPVKGAESKNRAAIIKACNVAGKDSCPECFPAGQCTTGEPITGFIEGQIDPFGTLIYCKEAGISTPTKAQAKCEDGVSKAFGKFFGSKTKCYDKCNQNMNKGKIAPGSCNPGAVTDPATQACIFDPLKGAEVKAAAAIDKVCALVAGATPSCYGTALDTGAEWVGLIEPQIDVATAQIACGP